MDSNGRGVGGLEEALDSVSDVFVLLDAEFRVVHHNEANRAAMRAAGADPDDAIGRVVWEVLPMPPGTVAEGECRRAMRDRVATQWEERYHPDLCLRGRAFPTADGGLVVVAQDVTAQWKADQSARAAAERAERLLAVTSALSQAATPIDVVRAVIAQGRDALGAAGGYAATRVDDDLEVVAALGFDADVPPLHGRFPLSAPYPACEVARTGQPMWIESRAERTLRHPAVAQSAATRAFESWMYLPLGVAGRVEGVLTFAFREPYSLTADDRLLALALAQQCALALERARLLASERAARAAAERAAARVRFLAEASVRLAASSLSLDDTLRTIARLAVPEVADWAFVSMRQPDGTIHPLAIHHRDPSTVALGWELMRRYPLDDSAAAGSGAVIRTGIPEMQGEIAPDFLRLVARDETHLAMLMEAGFRSHLIVPLRVGDDVAGALFLADAESGRRFGAADLELAEEVARRAGAAIENARLHEAERAARAAAEEANRAKLDFLRAMSHELRTPLNAIGGYAELLDLGVQGPTTDAQRTALGRIVSNQRHLLGIINDILNFARLDAGHLSYDLADLVVRDVLDATEPLIAPQLHEKHLAFDVAACAPELRVRADAEKLRQVMLNLLANAVKFTAPGGRVSVECEDGPTRVAVRVRDTGIGIAADRLRDIFQPFVQVHRSLVEPTAGTGLGLAISRELARGMGGDLTVESEEGVGSVFTVWLPRA